MPDKVWNIHLCKTEHEADNVLKAGPCADTCHLVPAHIFVNLPTNNHATHVILSTHFSNPPPFSWAQIFSSALYSQMPLECILPLD